MTDPEKIPPELTAQLARLMTTMPHGWTAGQVTPNPDGSYTVRIRAEHGEDAGGVILWPALPGDAQLTR